MICSFHQRCSCSTNERNLLQKLQLPNMAHMAGCIHCTIIGNFDRINKLLKKLLSVVDVEIKTPEQTETISSDVSLQSFIAMIPIKLGLDNPASICCGKINKTSNLIPMMFIKIMLCRTRAHPWCAFLYFFLLTKLIDFNRLFYMSTNVLISACTLHIAHFISNS